MNTTPTPRTDAVRAQINNRPLSVQDLLEWDEHASELERELAAVTAERDAYKRNSDAIWAALHDTMLTGEATLEKVMSLLKAQRP